MLLFCLFFFSEDENRASVFLLLILLKISHIFVVNQLLKRKNGVSFATLPGLFLLVRRVRRRDCRLVRNDSRLRVVSAGGSDESSAKTAKKKR